MNYSMKHDFLNQMNVIRIRAMHNYFLHIFIFNRANACVCEKIGKQIKSIAKYQIENNSRDIATFTTTTFSPPASHDEDKVESDTLSDYSCGCGSNVSTKSNESAKTNDAARMWCMKN